MSAWDPWTHLFDKPPVVWGALFSNEGALCCSHVGEGGEKYAIDATAFSYIKKAIDSGDAQVKIKPKLMTIGVDKDDKTLRCKSTDYCLAAAKSKTIYVVLVTAGEDGKKPEIGVVNASNVVDALSKVGY